MQREIRGTNSEVENLKKELMDRCSLKEVIGIKQQLISELQEKVDLKEVQQALNDCQNDIAEQLGQFKQKVQEKLVSQEVNLTRLIERKAELHEVK